MPVKHKTQNKKTYPYDKCFMVNTINMHLQL